jgi:transposase InsO family protein
MKSNFPHIGLARLCGWFGISRQAYYQHGWDTLSTAVEDEMIITQVKQIRSRHRRMGTRKLYELLQPFLLEEKIKIGRDALFDLLAANHLLVRKRRRRIQTTNSYHRFRKHPNLIRDMVPTVINQIWVCDITYWKLKNDHVYISLITDAYSHKIVGYHLGETMEAEESIQALKMALASLEPENEIRPIHHSDRGIQYCSNSYIKLLKENKIGISMTESGDPLENAIAERVNGIVKEEYLDNYEIDAVSQAKELLKATVNLYNKERPHMTLGNFTPEEIHRSEKELKPKRLWKNYYKKETTFVNPLQD